jgi:DNA-binding MarR family transcriptional regulator
LTESIIDDIKSRHIVDSKQGEMRGYCMEAIEESLLQQLAQTCNEVKQAFARHIGMSQARYQLLALLAQQGETSHAVLQQQLLLDGATITRLVKQFEAEGIVTRRLDPADNRYMLASLTESGQQIVAGISAAHHAFQAKVLEGITSENQVATLHALEQLRRNLQTIQATDVE